MLGPSNVLVGLSAPTAPAWRPVATVGTEPAYFSCQLGRKALINFRKNSEQTSMNRCGATIVLFGDAFVRGLKGLLHEFMARLFARQLLSFEVCNLNVETIRSGHSSSGSYGLCSAAF